MMEPPEEVEQEIICEVYYNEYLVGFDLKTIHELGEGPIILECHIQFLKEYLQLYFYRLLLKIQKYIYVLQHQN